jgi:hypothetical protein
MLISLLFDPPRWFQAQRWRMAAVRPHEAGRRRLPVLDSAALQDTGWTREHQEYVSAGRKAHSSMRRLHARAERLAAGLERKRDRDVGAAAVGDRVDRTRIRIVDKSPRMSTIGGGNTLQFQHG